MTTTPSVDPDQLARHIASMYRDVANATGHDLHFHTGPALAEALGYHLGLARVLAGERVLDLDSGSGTDVFGEKYAAQTIELFAVNATQERSK